MKTEKIPENRRSNVQRSREATTKLLQVAMEIISEEGMAGLTFMAIGERAGLSRELVRYYFGSKAGLVHHLLDSVIEKRRAYYFQRTKEGAAGIDIIFESLDTLVRTFKENPIEHKAHMLLLMQGVLDSDPAVRKKIHEYNFTVRERHAEFFREALQANGLPPDPDGAIISETYMGASRGINFQWVLEGDCYDFEGAIRALTLMLKHSIHHGLGGGVPLLSECAAPANSVTPMI